LSTYCKTFALVSVDEGTVQVSLIDHRRAFCHR